MMAQIAARNLRHPAPSFLLVPKGSRDWKIQIGIGFIQLFSTGFRLRLLFHLSSSSALQVIVRSFIRLRHSFFLPTFIFYRPLSSSHHVKIRLSLAYVSSFFDLRKP